MSGRPPAGSRAGRREDPPLLRGEGQFVDDVRGTRAPPLFLAFLRSPHASARILSLDASAAKQLSGVQAVYTGQDLAHLARAPRSRWVPGLVLPSRTPLAVDSVACVGRPVAAVVATARAIAEDAVGRIEVDYEIRDSVSDPEAALRPGAPPVHPGLGEDNRAFTAHVGEGDVAAQRIAAPRRVTARVVLPRVAPSALETRGGLAELRDGILTVWSSNQAVYRVRESLAELLNLPLDAVRVLAPDVGGAFGSKTGMSDEDLVLAHAAKDLDAAVKWTASRMEELLVAGHGRGQRIDLAGWFDAEGHLRALEGRIVSDLGAYPDDGSTISPMRALVMLPGPYRVMAARLEVVGAFTNLPPTGAYRGAGRPDATIAIERLMDVASQELGIDPVEIRRRNLVRADEFPWRNAAGKTYDSGDYRAALDRALVVADYPRIKETHSRGSDELVGVAASVYVEPSGGGGEHASASLLAGGRIEVRLGGTAHGQGHLTTFARLAAARLGIGEDRVEVRQGDTALLPNGVGTFASRSASVVGSAVHLCCQSLVAQGRARAAERLEVLESDVDFRDGRFEVKGAPRRAVTWADLAASGSGDEPVLSARELFTQEDEAYGFGAYVAVVRVSRETGQVLLDRLVAVDDCGVALEPRLVAGQAHGAVAQAIGQVLAERIVADDSGALITGSLLDYALPRAAAMTCLQIEHTVTPSPLNPLGAKGAGESGAVGAPPAIAAAVLDALGQLGARELVLPITSEWVWAALARQSG